MKITLKQFVVPTIPLAILLVTICVAIWLLQYVSVGTNLAQEYDASTFRILALPNTLLSSVINLSYTLLNAYLLAQFNNRFSIIRTRTFLPILIFVFLMAIWSEIHLAIGANIILTLFILALFQFFAVFRDHKATEQSFNGSLFIAVSSLFVQPLLFIIPICWIGLAMFQCFSLRTFLASIFGALTPWLLYLTVKFFIGTDVDPVAFLASNFSIKPDLITLSIPSMIYYGAMALIIIICLFGLFSSTGSDAIHTRTKLYFLLILLSAIIILCTLFGNQRVLLLPVLGLLYAQLVSHPFTLRQNKFYSILFIVFTVLNILFLITKYILF